MPVRNTNVTDMNKELDAQRQYVVIGTLALLVVELFQIVVCFLCKQGSGPEGGDVRVFL